VGAHRGGRGGHDDGRVRGFNGDACSRDRCNADGLGGAKNLEIDGLALLRYT
jgi:hypothetical protein